MTRSVCRCTIRPSLSAAPGEWEGTGTCGKKTLPGMIVYKLSEDNENMDEIAPTVGYTRAWAHRLGSFPVSITKTVHA
jgi:hypothetical protein